LRTKLADKAEVVQQCETDDDCNLRFNVSHRWCVNGYCTDALSS
jgi:hypothetical protein